MNDTRILHRLVQGCEQLTKNWPVIHPHIETCITYDELRVLIIDNYFDITIIFQAPATLYQGCGGGCIGGTNKIWYDIHQPERGQVHVNCFEAVSDLAPGIMKRIEEIFKYAAKPVNLAGYATGGALAVIFSEFLFDAGYTVNNLITFGQPRCADEDFINNVINHTKYVRVILQGDSFANTPGNFGCFGGLAHGGRQYILDLYGNLIPSKSDRDLAINFVKNKFTPRPTIYNIRNYVEKCKNLSIN